MYYSKGGHVEIDGNKFCLNLVSLLATDCLVCLVLRHVVPLISSVNLLSLYSTATQNTWRRGLALGNAPDARFLRWRYQHVGIFWRYLTLKFAFSPTPDLKFAFPPTPTPDASQWNIGCVGSLALGLCVGHVHFIFFVLISFASDTRRKPVFQWNMGYTF